MHEMDQILMTMMKLKLNLLQGDLAERFAVSQGLVSRILSYWIDTMEENLHSLAATGDNPEHNASVLQGEVDCSETNLQKPHNIDS